MGAFNWETRACGECGNEWEALDFWEADMVCGTCKTKRYEARLAAINAAKPYSVASLGGACPTQAEGRTANDRPFYFRARHGEWDLRLGNATDPTYYPDWDGWGDIVASGEDGSEGWMDEAEVLAILDAHLPA